jgi:hypothetical protein
MTPQNAMGGLRIAGKPRFATQITDLVCAELLFSALAMAESKPSAYAIFSARQPLKGDGSEEAPAYNFQYSMLHRNLFVYDALMAEEVLDALLVSGSGTARRGIRSSRPATVFGYGRWCMKSVPLPGALPAGPRVRCDGHLIERLQPSELETIDKFMHRRFERMVVTVQTENGFGGQEEAEALMYVCPTVYSEVLETSTPWNYTEFRVNHLNSFIEQVVRPFRRALDAEKEAEEKQSGSRSARPGSS